MSEDRSLFGNPDTADVAMVDVAAIEKRDKERRYLALLKTPPRFKLSKELKLTEKCKRSGRELWEVILLEARRRRRDQIRWLPWYGTDDEDGIVEEEQPFRILDLPLELRLKIYDFYFDEHRKNPYWSDVYTDWLSRKLRKHRPPPSLGGPDPRRHWSRFSPRTVRKDKEDKMIREVQNQLAPEPDQNSLAIFDIYEEYMKQHRDEKEAGTEDDDAPTAEDLHPHKCTTGCDATKNEHQDIEEIEVSESGNIIRTLPPLSLVSKQFFHETWRYCLGKHVRFRAHVLDFDFRPLYRLLRMLKVLGGRPVTFEDVSIEEWFTSINCDGTKFCWHSQDIGSRFCILEKVFWNHWIHGFPLKSSCEGLFSYWIEATSQTAALCRIDTTYWEELTPPYVKKFANVQGSYRGRGYLAKSGLELVEDTVWMFAQAAEYRLGYNGDWKVTDNDVYKMHGDDTYLYGPHIEATDKEYELVRIFAEYACTVDKALRERLGDCYEEYARLRKKEFVPDDGII
jgi:hypothetical protein